MTTRYGARDFLTDTDARARFMDKVVVENDHWWFRSGAVLLGGVSRRPRAAAYLLFVGPIPPDHTVRAHCVNFNCCNPDHLEARPTKRRRPRYLDP